MKPNLMLVVTSLLSILLLTLHVTDDIVRGISKAESSNIALLVLTVFLYGTLVLSERRSGHVIMLLVGLFAAAMPVIHMRGVHYGEIAKSTGGFFFVWTLWALGGLGGVTFILAARGLWNLRPEPAPVVQQPRAWKKAPCTAQVKKRRGWVLAVRSAESEIAALQLPPTRVIYHLLRVRFRTFWVASGHLLHSPFTRELFCPLRPRD